MRLSSSLFVAFLALGCGGARSGGGGGFFPDDVPDDAAVIGDDLGPGIDVQVPGIDVQVPGIDVQVPGIDVQGPGSDVPRPGIDVVNPQPGMGTLGAMCTRLNDCMSGVCLPSGRCSRSCGAPGDCPGSWQCTSLPGLGPVCACTPRGVETCNEVDDDCDGLVDEGFTRCNGRCANLTSDPANCGACGVSCGGGTSCVGGMCACPSTASLACGGRCVNPRTDPANCGACGRACTGGMACVDGTCRAAGVCPSGCALNSDCNPCRTPGDPGLYCCVSGLCIYMSGGTCGGGGPVDSGLPDVSPPSDTGVADAPRLD